jgi:hypothetical protein
MAKSNESSPFALRMECLHMAQSLLSEKMHMSKDVEGNSGVVYYSTEDVLKEAAKFNAFVCDRNAAQHVKK